MSAAAPPSAVVRGLRKLYARGVTALDGLDLEVRPGELFGLVGENGAGKTTLLRILGGHVRPTSGTAHVLGIDVAADPTSVRALVGSLAAEDDAPPQLTGREAVELVGRLHGLSAAEAQGRAADLLAFLEVGAADRDRALGDYSTGTRRKTALACALVHAPRVLLLDEPLASLDPVAVAVVRRSLRTLASRGCAVVCSSHALDVLDEDCSRIAVLASGRLRASGTPAEVRAEAGVAPSAPLLDAYLALAGGHEALEPPEWLA